MANYPQSGTIKWTGYSTSESSIRLSYPYTTGKLLFGALINGTMGPLDEGLISIMPLNYKLKSGKEKITQRFGTSMFGTTIPIVVTPKSSYENTRIELMVSISEAPSYAVLTAKTWIG